MILTTIITSIMYAPAVENANNGEEGESNKSQSYEAFVVPRLTRLPAIVF